MKSLPIRFKITLWFSAALIVVVFFSYLIVLSVSNQIIQKTIRDNLIETVENNVDEIEYFSNINEIYEENDVDQYMEYVDGYLEIDDDFLDQVNEVYSALYREDNTLLYGENPISKETSLIGFRDGTIQKITVDHTLYYIFDRKLTMEGLETLWLRGIVSESQGAVQMSDIIWISLIILPILVLLAVGGGYLIAKKTLRPIQNISETACQIGKNGDLKKRIEIGRGKDEIHQLADNFNEMFGRLEETFETERQFISDASHELRTPMSVINAQCEFSLEQPRTAEEYEKALRVIQRQSRKMSKLINDMLDFTRLEMKSNRYLKETIHMTELVTSICFDMSLIKEKGITLTCQAEENVLLKGNQELLSRLLSNLISNAYRYGRENGRTDVRLSRRTEGVELSVTDNGIGIAEEEQKKIFRRFYQVDPSRSDRGTGLGLSMVYEIVRFHGGEIAVNSKLGEGSSFVVKFPKN